MVANNIYYYYCTAVNPIAAKIIPSHYSNAVDPIAYNNISYVFCTALNPIAAKNIQCHYCTADKPIAANNI